MISVTLKTGVINLEKIKNLTDPKCLNGTVFYMTKFHKEGSVIVSER